MANSLAVSSGALTGTTLLFNGTAHLNAVQLVLDGTNAGTVTCYDSLTGTGKVIAILSGAATSTGSSIVHVCPVRCDIGLTIVVAGTGAQAIVAYNA